jgi:hypothetical protein
VLAVGTLVSETQDKLIAAEHGWNAAKMEILNQLSKAKRETCSHGWDAGSEYVDWDDIEEIINNM